MPLNGFGLLVITFSLCFIALKNVNNIPTYCQQLEKFLVGLKMYSIVVTNEVKQGFEQSYKSIMMENARASVENEVGCYRFDILQDQQQASRFYLNEIYQNKQALAVHKTTLHYLQSRKQLAGIVVSQSVIRAKVILTNPI